MLLPGQRHFIHRLLFRDFPVSAAHCLPVYERFLIGCGSYGGVGPPHFQLHLHHQMAVFRYPELYAGHRKTRTGVPDLCIDCPGISGNSGYHSVASGTYRSLGKLWRYLFAGGRALLCDSCSSEI